MSIRVASLKWLGKKPQDLLSEQPNAGRLVTRKKSKPPSLSRALEASPGRIPTVTAGSGRRKANVGEQNPLVSTIAAISNTLKTPCFICRFSGIYVSAILVLSVSGLVWQAYQKIQPPPPEICGSPNGPPVDSPRIRLRDGRYLAYRERGVPKENSKHRIIVVHGFDNSKDMILAASQELIDELGIYFLSFDRAGYGESDPNPKRSVKSEALDIQELADQLQLGDTFYVLGVSMGGYPIWGCLRYIPHRLAGAALVVPIVNYWWPSLPSNLSREAYKKQLLRDQWSLWVAHYIPQLLHWWMTQKWFPSLSLVEENPDIFSMKDKAIIEKMSGNLTPNQTKVRQQGLFESLHRDLMVGFGTWEFDPLDLINPFPQTNSSVHIWQGYEDRLVPSLLQRYVSWRLPWIQYHEVPDGGHLIMYDTGLFESILRALLH